MTAVASEDTERAELLLPHPQYALGSERNADRLRFGLAHLVGDVSRKMAYRRPSIGTGPG